MNSNWPPLNYSDWKPTYETLHRWFQIVGKAKLCHEPWTNHSWASTLSVTSRGLGTGAVSNGHQNFSVDFDFIHHNLLIQTSQGHEKQFPLKNMSVEEFYRLFTSAMNELCIKNNFSILPNELPDATPFDKDHVHHTYNPQQTRAFFHALVSINNILKKFRAGFEGKASPVHFFWGSFDLAVTRFSGRTAPEHPGGVPHLPNLVTREAYSHEVSSCGFWPGNDMVPYPAFYSYAYPEPEGFSNVEIEPEDAFYHPDLKEFILPYDTVRNSVSPEKTLAMFFQSTFNAAAKLGNWDKSVLQVSPYLKEIQRNYHA